MNRGREASAVHRRAAPAIDPVALKTAWLEHSYAAEREIEGAAEAGVEVGLAFVSVHGEIGWFDQSDYVAHRATLGGALPRVIDGS